MLLIVGVCVCVMLPIVVCCRRWTIRLIHVSLALEPVVLPGIRVIASDLCWTTLIRVHSFVFKKDPSNLARLLIHCLHVVFRCHEINYRFKFVLSLEQLIVDCKLLLRLLCLLYDFLFTIHIPKPNSCWKCACSHGWLEAWN